MERILAADPERRRSTKVERFQAWHQRQVVSERYSMMGLATLIRTDGTRPAVQMPVSVDSPSPIGRPLLFLSVFCHLLSLADEEVLSAGAFRGF